MNILFILFFVFSLISNTANAIVYDGYEALELYAEVIEAGESREENDEYMSYIVQDIKVKILDERFENEEYNIVYALQDGMNTRLPLYSKLKVGDRVYVYGIYENNKLQIDAVSYYDITPWVILLFAIFALLIIIIGRKNGIKALISLLLTIILVFAFLIPAILDSKDPIIYTVMLCAVVIVVTFIIISGFKKKTLVAIIGTTAGVIASALMGVLFSNLMRLTGINEHARMISTIVSEEKEMINFKGVLLSAIMISAMGACMDIGMSISSALSELKDKKPDLTSKELIKSGMNIGKDVMGTMTNTLILAYVGSAMLCILLYNVNGFDLPNILHQEDISNEVLKSLAGSIGLICTIPFTAIFGGLIIGSNKSEKNVSSPTKKEEDIDIPVKFFQG